MSLWVTALIPHILLWFKKGWFLTEGTLGEIEQSFFTLDTSTV